MGRRRADRALLRRDEEELRNVAESFLRAGRFAVVACAEELRAAATRTLLDALGEGWAIEDLVLDDAAQVPALLARHAAPSERTVVAIAFGAHRPDVVDAMNLHREKLQRPTARYLLWAGGTEAFRELLRRAPDLYSFRDAAAVIRGEDPPPPEVNREPAALARARDRLARTPSDQPLDRADALQRLANALRVAGLLVEAERAVAEALDLVEEAGGSSPRGRQVAAHLLHERGALAAESGRGLDGRRLRLEALNLPGGPTGPAGHVDVGLRVSLLAQVPAPPGLGFDLASANRATRETGVLPARSAAVVGVGLGVALACRHDLDAAAGWLRIAWDSAQDPFHRAGAARALGLVEREAGRWGRAFEQYRSAAGLFAAAGAPEGVRRVETERAALLGRTGEIGAAERALALVCDGDARTAAHGAAALLRASLLAARGDTSSALARFREVARAAASGRLPEVHLDGVRRLAGLLRDARAAGDVPDRDLAASDAELLAAQELGAAIAGDDPPWYPILYRNLRAGHLAERDVEDATAVQREAYETALSGWPELAPEAGRRLADLHVRAGRAVEAPPILDRCEALGVEHHLLGEIARLLAVRLIAAAAGGGADLVARESALREAIGRTGSGVLKAEMLYEVGRRLPEGATGVDRLALLEEARGGFRDLPWPEKEGLCLEALGRAARAAEIYRRHGLALRLRALQRREGGRRAR